MPRIRSIVTIHVTSAAPSSTAATPVGFARTSVRSPLSDDRPRPSSRAPSPRRSSSGYAATLRIRSARARRTAPSGRSRSPSTTRNVFDEARSPCLTMIPSGSTTPGCTSAPDTGFRIGSISSISASPARDTRDPAVEIELVRHRDAGPRSSATSTRARPRARRGRRRRASAIASRCASSARSSTSTRACPCPVDRARPLDHDREREAVERNAVELPALDVPRPSALAVALRRKRVEVARAAVVAVARDQHGPFELPLHRGRGHAAEPTTRPWRMQPSPPAGTFEDRRGGSVARSRAGKVVSGLNGYELRLANGSARVPRGSRRGGRLRAHPAPA